MGSEFLVIFILVILNGLFSMAEIALVSSRKSRLEAQAKKGNKSAKIAIKLHNEPARFLSTVQVGITLIGILTGAYSGGELQEYIKGYLLQTEFFAPYAQGLSLTIVVILITYITLIFGELVPKQIGLADPEKISSAVARPMLFISAITYPFVYVLSSSTNLVIKIFRLKKQDEPTVTEEEIKSLVAQGATSGDVEEVENEIIQRVFNLGDRKVGSLMTARLDLEWIDLEDDYYTNRSRILQSSYSNLPVCKDGIDNVQGILKTKRFYKELTEGNHPDIAQQIETPIFIPENMTAFTLLEKFKEKKTKVAMVVDEYGSMQGMVTMADLIDALVGEMEAPTNEEETIVIERADGSFLIDALMPFDDFIARFELDDLIKDEDVSGFHTLGGFILHLNEQIPSTGEIFIWNHISFEVIDMDGNRIDKLLVRFDASESEKGQE